MFFVKFLGAFIFLSTVSGLLIYNVGICIVITVAIVIVTWASWMSCKGFQVCVNNIYFIMSGVEN